LQISQLAERIEQPWLDRIKPVLVQKEPELRIKLKQVGVEHVPRASTILCEARRHQRNEILWKDTIQCSPRVGQVTWHVERTSLRIGGGDSQ
jgi:hypothetical protein